MSPMWKCSWGSSYLVNAHPARRDFLVVQHQGDQICSGYVKDQLPDAEPQVDDAQRVGEGDIHLLGIDLLIGVQVDNAQGHCKLALPVCERRKDVETLRSRR